MTFRKSVKRGEIYYYDFGTNEGSVQNGCRPVLVVQCDEGNQASETTIIAAITTSKKRYCLRTFHWMRAVVCVNRPLC